MTTTARPWPAACRPNRSPDIREAGASRCHESPPPQRPGTSLPLPCWDTERYPLAMIGLPPEVRELAIEAANALTTDGHSEARAIALGIARAWEWRARGARRSHEPLRPASARHVIFEHGAWSVALDGLDEPLRRFDCLDDALHHAHELARQDDGCFYVYVDQGLLAGVLECFGRPWTGGPSLFQVMPYDGGWAVHRVAGDSRFFESIDEPGASTRRGPALEHRPRIA